MSEIDCTWLKIFDTDGNLLSPDAVYVGQTIYLDISGIPAGYLFDRWTDLQQNPLTLEFVGNDRYKATISCGNGFIAHLKEQTPDSCEVMATCNDDTMGDVIVSGDYNICNSQARIIAEPKNCCYEFVKWDDASPDNENEDRLVPVSTGQSIYTAIFQPRQYIVSSTVIPNNNYGSVTITKEVAGGGEVQADTVMCGEKLKLTATPNTGYEFVRWDDGETAATREIIFDCNELPNASFQAEFRQISTYALRYNSNDSTPLPSSNLDSQSPYQNGAQFMSWVNTAYSRQGYTLRGWSLTSGPNNTVDYYPGTLYTYAWQQDITLYAVWEENRIYNINYYGDDPNDYTHFWTYDTHVDGTWFSLRTPLPQTGYTFQGWVLLPTGTTYNPNDPNNVVEPAGTQKLMPAYDWDAYGVWVVDSTVTLCLTYNKNGATSGNDLTVTNIVTGSTVNLIDPANIPISWPHHSFVGWGDTQTSPNITYQIGDPLTINTNTTVYAQWLEDPTVVIDYDMNGGSGTTPPSQTVYVYDSVTVADDSGFSRANYTFLGWSTNPNDTQAIWQGSAYISVSQNMTLYAIWERIPTCRVTYFCNDRNIINDQTEYVDGDTVTVMQCNNSCSVTPGCTFDGWSLTQGGTLFKRCGETFTIHANTYLYQHEVCCGITFNVDCPSNGCNPYYPPRIYWKENEQAQANYITEGVSTPIEDGWIVDVDMGNGNPTCYFTGWFNPDELSYLTPIYSGCSNTEQEYKRVPSAYVNDILTSSQPNQVYRLSDTDYNNQVKYKNNNSITMLDGHFIYNNITGEMRQLLHRCLDDSEAYDIGNYCGGTLIAVIECCSVAFSFDYQNEAIVEINGSQYSTDTGSSLEPINVPVRVGQSFTVEYDDTRYYVTDVIDMDTGESVGICNCCYDSFPVLDPQKQEVWYYKQIPNIPMGVPRKRIYDKRYVVDANSPEYVIYHDIANGTDMFGHLEHCDPCNIPPDPNNNNVSQIQSDLIMGSNNFYGITPLANDYNIPNSTYLCANPYSFEAGFVKAITYALIRINTNCQYAVDCGHRYHICIAERSYQRAKYRWQSVVTIPSGLQPYEILNTHPQYSQQFNPSGYFNGGRSSFLCFLKDFDVSNLWNAGVRYVDFSDGGISCYYELVQNC